MSVRVLSQTRLVLQKTTLPALRVAVAQRVASVPLPVQYSVTRAFSISRPWFAAQALPSQQQPAQDAPAPKPANKQKTEDELVPFEKIKDLVSPETYEAITYKPYQLKNMTPVQAAVLSLLPQLVPHHTEIKPGPDGKSPPRDLMVRAKTGTGKTLAFLVPAVEARVAAIERAKKEILDKNGLDKDRMYEGQAVRAFTRTSVGSLIISPTRELATQIANEALKLTHHHDGFEVRLFVGGSGKREQVRGWMRGRRDIVVATPGRLRDFLQNDPSFVDGMKTTQMLILDEADTLLDMGFRDDLEDIMSYLPRSPERQTMLYSATVSRAIQQVARASLDKNHQFISTVRDEDSPVHAHIPQFHTVLPRAEDQLPHILRLLAHDQLSNPGKSKVILFFPTTKMTQLYAELLRELARDILPAGRGTQIYEIHSKKEQESRYNTSSRFRRDTSGASILVTSDVSARGVDYPGVTRVIQVGIPSSPDQYTHRVGRTGRAGTEGRGDMVLLPWEIGFVTWQLTHVPMKPTTVKQVEAELLALAAKHDENPSKFYTPPPAPRPGRRDQRPEFSPVAFSPRSLERVNQIPTIVKETLAGLDPMVVDETFASLLGYYIAKTPEIRVEKGVALQGCKDWATGAAGLPSEPYVSEGFLAKLGYNDGRTKRFGAARTAYTAKDSGKRAPWEMRGNQRRNREDGMGRFGDRDRGFGDRDRGFGDRDRAFGDRDRAFGDRDKSFGDRDKSFGDRDKSFGDRDKSFGDRDKPFGDRDKVSGDRDKPFGDRDKPFGDRDKPFGGRDKPFGDRGRTFGDRDRAFGDRNRDREFGDKDRSRGFGMRDGRDRFGDREGGGRFGDRENRGRFGDQEDRGRSDNQDGDRPRRSVLEDPENASEFLGTRYGRNPRRGRF